MYFLYFVCMKINTNTTPFKTGGSIAVRIPKKFHLELDDEIEITSPKDGVIVIKVSDKAWKEEFTRSVNESVDSGIWDDLAEPTDPQPEPIDSW